VVNAKGSGQSNVRILLTDSSGNVRSAVSNTFGFYRFEGVQAGETYIVSAQSRRYRIENPTRVLAINEERNDIDFVVSD